MHIIEFEPNGQNRTAEVVEALRNAPDHTRLVFSKGKYDFYAEGAYEGRFYPTCNRSGDKKVIFYLSRARDIEVDGCGSDFIFHDRVTPFIAQDCADVSLKNFTIDFSFPRCCLARVISSSEEGVLIDIRSSGCEYSVNEAGNLQILAGSDLFSTCETRFFLKQDLNVCYLSAGEIYYENNGLPAEAFYCEAANTKKGVLLRYNSNTRYKPNFTPGPIMISYDERRQNDVFLLDKDRNVVFEDVRVYHGAGMGVVGMLCENLRFHRFAIAPPEGSEDLYSTTADGILLSNCTGRVEIDECLIKNTLDDAMSIHGFYTRVERVTAPCKALAKLDHVSLAGYNPYFPGDVLTVSDGAELCETGTITVKSSRIEDDPNIIFLEFDGDIRGALKPGDLLENACRTPEVFITNSVFAKFPALRLSTARPVRFEGNSLSDCAGILLNDLVKYWRASGCVNDVEIKNNVFKNVNTGIRTILERPAGCGVRHKSIKITDNRFEGCEVLLSAERVNSLRFTGNVADGGGVEISDCYNCDIQDIEGSEASVRGQLLMRWDVAPVSVPPARDGYRLHQYHRGGDDTLSSREFEAGWLRVTFQGKPFSPGSFEWLDRDARVPDDGFFVALDSDGRMVSTASVQIGEHTPDSATLHMVSTDINHRGHGTGTLVTLAAMDYMHKRGFKAAYLTTDEFRLPAIKIYLKHGYMPVLYAPDMRARWRRLIRDMELGAIAVIDEAGKPVQLRGE